MGCVVAASLAATAASAADLPAPAPAAPPPAYHPPVYDWSGIYLGGHFGGAWMNDTVQATATPQLFPVGTSTKVAPMGVLGGAQAGVNIEFAPVVIGFEGTWTATTLSGSNSVISPISTPISQRSTDAAPWLATATGRIGYAANDLLFYVKGGGAWMQAQYTQAETSFGVLSSATTLTDNRTGWTVGGGFEYGLNENLSLKFEYDYLGFGTKTYTFNNLSYVTNPGGNPPVSAPLGPLPVSVKSQMQMVTAGVNYRFTWR